MLPAFLLLLGATQFEYRRCDAVPDGTPCCDSCRSTKVQYDAGLARGHALRERTREYLPVSGDHCDSRAFKVSGKVHGLGFTLVFLLLPFQWALSKGTAWHQRRGRALAFAFALLIPTGFLLVYLRVPYTEARHPRIFPTSLQWVGVCHFGLAFVAAVCNALVPAKRGAPGGWRRSLCLGTSSTSLLWGLFMFYAYVSVLSTAPKASELACMSATCPVGTDSSQL